MTDQSTKQGWAKADREFLKRYRFDEPLFRALQDRVASGQLNQKATALVGHIEPPGPSDVVELPMVSSLDGQRLLALGQASMRSGEVGVVVVAGGMATRFGGGAKGVVEVKHGESFISLEVRDCRRAGHNYGHPVPLGIMTSFATHEAIVEHLKLKGLHDPRVHLFTQGVAMRMTPSGALAVDGEGAPSYYAPGHGEFFAAIKIKDPDGKSLLDHWPQVKTIFFKNVDNKGAIIASDLFAMILGVHLEKKNDMTAEVVAKNPGDAGGVVARVDGRLRGVEGFRLTGDQSVFPDFSPNNLLFRKEALFQEIPMEHHYVEKKVDGQTVVQLEQVALEASGSNVFQFGAVRVPRTRFVPVKEPADLATLRQALDGELGREYGLI